MSGWLVRFDAERRTVDVETGAGAERGEANGVATVVASDRGAARLAAELAQAARPSSPIGVAAAARWPPSAGRVELVRDRAGLYPLFYARRDGITIAGTDLRTVVTHPEIRARPSPALLRAWLDGQPLGPSETLFDGVHRVPAGHIAESTPEGIVIRHDWNPPTPRSHPRSAAARFGELLESAVARHAELGRPAVFLSGGLDSASVAAAAAAVGNPIALCVDFPGASELATQRTVSDSLGIPREEVAATASPELVQQALTLVESSLWPVAAPWSPVFEALAERARVAGAGVILDGLGGDELLDAGYAAGRELLVRPWWLRSWLRAERRYAGGVLGSLRAVARGGRPSYAVERARDAVSARLAMQREDSFDRGLRTGVPRRHPLWDAAVVDLLDGLPPEALVAGGHPKSPARSYLAARVPAIAGPWPRPRVADSVAAALTKELQRVRTDSGVPLLERLGIVSGTLYEPTPHFTRLWLMLSVERWLEGVEAWGEER